MEKKKVNTYKELLSWKKAMELCFFIYSLTNHKKFESDFDLRRQIRKSSISPASNIAEGYGRRGNRELSDFISIALGSLCELETQLIIASEFNFISKDEFEKASELISDCSNLCGGLINYLNNTEYTGTKFKREETKEPALVYGFDVQSLIDN